MSGWYNQLEVRALLTDESERAQAVADIFDNAMIGEDLQTLLKIRDSYPRAFLETALGGYPDYLDANDLREEQ